MARTHTAGWQACCLQLSRALPALLGLQTTSRTWTRLASVRLEKMEGFYLAKASWACASCPEAGRRILVDRRPEFSPQGRCRPYAVKLLADINPVADLGVLLF